MGDTVALTFAAQTQNVALARTLAAAMSARTDLPLDQLEDVRLAVDEAVTQVIAAVLPGARITCTFDTDGSTLSARVSGPTAAATPPSTNSFSWTVLSALVDSVEATIIDGELVIAFTVTSDLVDV